MVGEKQGEEGRRTLLSSVEEFLLFLVALVELNDFSASEELHDEAGSDDGGDAELHESTTVGGEDDT